jgi:methylmalonyl-CoA/ethylmalonyl-CoA epimerase
MFDFRPQDVFHYGYVVANMDRALRSWTAMGAAVVVPPAIDPIQNVSCCFLTYLDAVPIELIAPMPTGPNPIASRLSKGGGLDHVCLFVDDLEGRVQALVDEGATLVVPPCFGAVFNRRLAFLVTRAGLVVELMTRQVADRQQPDPLAEFIRR